jgi:16S rRNA processing protein RimM
LDDLAPEGLLEVGRIGRAHGVRGALHVVLTTDRTERVAAGARLHDGRSWLTVVSSRTQPGSRFVVQFEGIEDRNAAERLTGRVLSASPIEDADAVWIHELIGARVVDAAGVDRGVCVSVLDNPAHDIMELDTGHLVPVTFIDRMVDGVVHVDAPDGLFDLLD